jgi:hypothetical protein
MWTLALSPRAKDEWLRRAIDDPDLALGGELLRAFRAKAKRTPVTGRRTVAQLLSAAATHRERRERAESSRAERANKAAEAARMKRLDALAKRVDEAWAKLEVLVAKECVRGGAQDRYRSARSRTPRRSVGLVRRTLSGDAETPAPTSWILRSVEARERAATMVSDRVTVQDFRGDPMSPRIERAVAAILERAIRGSLSRLSRLLRILGYHCHDLNLVPSHTAYVKWGKGTRTPLRFTKTGEKRLEQTYARHFVWPGNGPFHPPRPRGSPAQAGP